MKKEHVVINPVIASEEGVKGDVGRGVVVSSGVEVEGNLTKA